MTPWQILQASRAASAARDFYSQHGGGGPWHCSSYLSRGKTALQELNGRLAWYLQQVHNLEASNQRLEMQIRRELDRKCPRDQRHLDKHLRTASVLQQRIHEDVMVQAQLKAQLLSAELNISGLKLRCDHEDKQGRVVQEQLSNLWLLWEDLQVQLPHLQDLLNHLSGQMMEMQLRHQEDTQYLQAQIFGGITVDNRPGQSSALMQQLDHLRWTNDKLFRETLGDSWCGNQVRGVQMSQMRPEVAFNHHEDLEFYQLELEQLRRSAMILEAELTQLEAQNEVLEASGMELENTLDQDLLVLEEGEDLLCHNLNSLLQASAQQAEDHQILLGVKYQLENEIHDYRRLLEGLEQQWVPGFSSRFSNPFGTPTFPSTFTRNVTVNQMVSLPRRRIYMKEVQPLRESFTTLRQTAVAPVFEPVVSTVQSIKAQDKLPSNSHSSTDLILSAENRRIVSAGGQTEDQESSVVCVQVIQSRDEGESLRESIASLPVPDTKSEPDGQTGTDGCSVQSHSVTTRTSTQPNQAPQILTRLSLYDLSKQTAAEESKETAMAGFPQQNGPEGATQTPDQDHGQIIPVTLKTEEEAYKTAASDTVTSSCISVEAAGSVPGHVVLIDQIGLENQGNTEGTTLTIVKLDSPSSQTSNAEQHKVMETTAECSSSTTASAITSDSNGHAETKVEIKLFPSELYAKGLDVQEISESFISTQISVEEHLLDNKMETNKGKPETAPKMNLTQASAEDQDQGQVVPISREIQSETDKTAGLLAVTVCCLSGPVSQSTVSVEATLVPDNKVQKLADEVEVQTVVSRVGQGSAIELNTALADQEKQAASAPTEALHYENVSNITECTTSSQTFIQANGLDTKIQSVVTEAQLKEKPGPTPVPQLEEADSTKQAQLQKESEAVLVDQSTYPADQGQFLSFESFQSLRRPKPRSNTLWMVLFQSSSQDNIDQGHEKEEERHITETMVNIREVERYTTLKKEAEQSQSFRASQCLQDRHDTTLVTETCSTVLNATNSSGPAGQESGLRLNGLLDGSDKSAAAHQEQTLPLNGTSGSVSTGDTGETKVVQDQGVHPGGQSDQQEVSSVQADVKEHNSELSQVQTVSISEESETVLTGRRVQIQIVNISEQNEKVLTDQTPELQTVSNQEQSEEVLTDQTELPTVNIIVPSEEVLTDQSVQLQVVSMTEESETVLTNQTTELQTVSISEESETALTDQSAELQTVSIPEESETVLTNQTTELQTVSISEQTERVLTDQSGATQTAIIAEVSETVLTDQTVQLQTVSIPEESETVLTNQTTEVQTVSIPEESETVLTNQTTEVQTVSIPEESETVLTDQTVQLQTVSIPEESETVLTNQTTEVQTVSIPEESETVLTNQTTEVQTVSISEESETALTDQSAELQTVSIPEESETVLTNERTSLDDTTGGSATSNESKASHVSSSGKETVVLTAKVTVDDHREPKRNEGRPRGPNLTTSLSKDITSNGTISARKQEESRTVVNTTSKEGLINESRLGFNSTSEKISTLINKAAERSSRVKTEPSEASTEKGRFSHENWIVYGGGLGRERSLNRTRSADSLSTVTLPSEIRSGNVESKDQTVDRGSPKRSNGTKGGDSLRSAGKIGGRPKGSRQTSDLAEGAGRFGQEEWKVYGGGSPGRIRTWKSSDSLGKDEAVAVLTKIAVPAVSVEPRRLGSAASDEWRVYGGSAERISRRSSGKGFPKTVKEEVSARGPEPLGDLGGTGVSAGSSGRVSNWVSSSIRPGADKEATPAASSGNPPASSSESQGAGRLGSGHSGEWRVYGGSAGRLSRSTSADTVSVQASSHTTASAKLSTGSAGSSSGMSSSHRISTSGRYASTGSVERKPVYSPASARKNSAGSGSKLSGQSSVRISSSSRPGTTSAAGGRVIVSSSRPIRSTGSGVGDNKERISVCKMAALSIAAAGRGRGQDQQQKQEAASTPLLPRWLTSGGHQRANLKPLDSSAAQQK